MERAKAMHFQAPICIDLKFVMKLNGNGCLKGTKIASELKLEKEGRALFWSNITHSLQATLSLPIEIIIASH